MFRTTTLGQMAELTPTSLEDLRKIEGVTNTNIGRLGDDRMLEITAKYAAMAACKLDCLLEIHTCDKLQREFRGTSSGGFLGKNYFT